jgi:hypothetical protein
MELHIVVPSVVVSGLKRNKLNNTIVNLLRSDCKLMNLYIGDYWAPFPSSEYGGIWVVMAENEEQVIDILEGTSYDDEYEDCR